MYEIFNNVSAISFSRPDKWNVVNSNESLSDEEAITFFRIVVDEQSLAFGHWVFESAVFIPIYLKIKSENPKKKFLLWQTEERKFRRLFYNYFNISIDDIYTSHSLPLSNKVILPSSLSILQNNSPISQEYSDVITDFISYFNIGQCIASEVLLLPRQKVENYPGNDRECDWVRLFNYAEKKGIEILNTDCIEDLRDQIKKVNSAKHVIISDGSAFSVNGLLFCRNQVIYVIEPYITLHQELLYIRAKFIADNIRKNNKVYYVTQDEMINILDTYYK